MKKKAAAPETKGKRLRRVFFLGDNDEIKITVERPAGVPLRLSSNEKSLVIATGDTELPQGPLADVVPLRAAAPPRAQASTSVERSGEEFTTNVSDEGPGIGAMALPAGIDPLAAMQMTPEAIMALNNQARSLTVEKGSDVVHESDVDMPNITLAPRGGGVA